MDWGSVVLLVILVAGVMLGGVAWQRGRVRRAEQRLADARADAQRWYDRLGGQVMNLAPNDDPAVRQALVDAGERYNASGSQLEAATTVRQYELARETAIEGLHYVRAAREGLGLDPGPELPMTEAQRRNGVITREREVTLENGEHLKAAPRYGRDTPYYYPGGMMQGRHVPAGYYSQPWWQGALATGAGVFGGMLLFDALFGGFGDGYGDFGGGFDGGDFGGGDFGDFGGF